MAQKKKFDIPELPRGLLPVQLESKFAEWREALQKLIGTRGDGTDAAVSWDALMRAGFAEKPGSVIDAQSLSGGVDEVDNTQPPTPTGLTLTPGTTQVIVEWDAPSYTAGRGHGQTNIYAVHRPAADTSPAPVFGDAPLVDVAAGAITVYSLPSEFNTKWWVWIKWQSLDGVESDPAGGTNGVTGTTSQDVGDMLEALAGEITTDELSAALAASVALIEAPDTTTNSPAWRVKQEADARAAALLVEANNRTSAIDAKAAELTDDFEAADAALATSLTSAFEAADATTLASAQAFTYSRTAIDSAVAATLSTLRAEFAAADSTTLASAQAYTYSQATIDSSISSSVSTLRSQLTGGYTGTDLDALTSGLLYIERTTRTTQVNSLSQQIALLSAGAGEQFDYSDIWYFDSGLEGWTASNATDVSLTTDVGWLVLKASTGTQTDRNPVSPDNLSIDGAKYPQIRARIRKYGSPTWEGGLWWTTTADNTWTSGKSVTIAEPSYDGNGIAVVTWDAPSTWTAATIRRLSVNLSTSVSTTDYYTLDWVAVGRPSPGASSAQLADEQTARAAADSAEVSARQALSAKLTGVNDPASATLAGLTSGLLYDERQARATADTAQASRIDTLEATVNNATTGVAATATALDAVEVIVNHATSGNSALATRTSSLESSVNNGTTGLAATRALLLSDYKTEAETDSAISSVSTALQAQINAVDKAPFSAFRAWNFNGTLDGWARYYGSTYSITPTAGETYATIGFPVNGHYAAFFKSFSASEQFAASSVSIIRAKVSKPVAGAAVWRGYIFFTTNADPIFNAALYTPEPVWDADNWAIAEWVVPAGLATWHGKTITGLLLDIGISVSPGSGGASQMYVDWIAAGTKQASASYSALTRVETALVTQDTANSAATSAVNARLNSGGDTYASIVSATNTATTALNNAATADGKAVAAQNTANTASTNATNALATLADIASDSLLTPDEKPRVIQDRDVILAEQTGIDAQATAFSITTEKTAYDAAVTALTTYLATLTDPVLWSNLAGNTSITGSIFRSKFADVYAARQTLLNKIAQVAKARADSAYGLAETTASSVTTLQSQMTGATGSNLLSQIQTEATTRASETGALGARYTVKTSVAGLVSGFGLASEANNAAPTSAFGIQAGSFFVAPPAVESATEPTTDLYPGYVWRDTSNNTTKYRTAAGGWSTSPQVYQFSVQTSPTTVNGVSIPAGVYIDGAYVNNLTAMWARFGTLVADSIQATAINASQLTLGTGIVGGNLRSTTYTGGSVGWIVRPDGFAEFSNIVARGAIYASTGTIGGSFIGSNYMQSTTWVSGSTGWRWNSDGTGWIGGIYAAGSALQSSNFSAGSAGFQLKNDGTFEANNATLRGGLDVTSTGYVRGGQTAYNTGAGFWGGYSGGAYKFSIGNPSGSYLTYDGTDMVLKGKFTADAVDAVDTLNLKGDAILVPQRAFFQRSQQSNPPNVSEEVMFTFSSINLPASNARIIFFIRMSSIFTQSTSEFYSFKWVIRRNGTDIFTSQTYSSVDGWLEVSLPMYTFVDTPTVGAFVYQFALLHNPGLSQGYRGAFTVEATMLGVKK